MSDEKSKVEFRVGDRVKTMVNVGGKPNTAGEIGTVKGIKGEWFILVEFDNDIGGHDGNDCIVNGNPDHCWFVDPENLQHVSTNQTVVIYPKGRETFAVLKEGNRIVRTAKATYNPNDAKEGLPYKFEIGAELAFQRLFGKAPLPSMFFDDLSINWDDFKAGKIAVHCDTEEKAKAFLKECSAQGITWSDGDEITPDKTYWDCHEENTGYYMGCFGFGFGSVHYRKEEGIKIVDYPWIVITRTPSSTIRIVKQDHYKVGDKVKIREDIAKIKDTYGAGVLLEMHKQAGKIATITSVYEYEHGKYNIDLDAWTWSNDMIEGKVIEEPSPASEPQAFDWEAFKLGKFAVKCDTEEKARQFLSELKMHGIRWSNGEEINPNENSWSIYKEKTCYGFFVYCGRLIDKGIGFGTDDGTVKTIPYIPNYREVKRLAKAGEWVRIVHAGFIPQYDEVPEYANGDILRITEIEGDVLARYAEGCADYGVKRVLSPFEYVVLEECIPEKHAVKEVKRLAKAGEWIKVSKNSKDGRVDIGDVYKVSKSFPLGVEVNDMNGKKVACLWHSEYVVLEDCIPEEPPILPFRKAKRGDIIKITKGEDKGREFTIFYVNSDYVEAKGCNPFYDKDESYIIVKEAPETIEVGDVVKVTSSGNGYTHYSEWFDKFAPKFSGRYAYGTEVKNGFIGKVVAKHEHGSFSSDGMLYAIKGSMSRAVYLIGERGIEKVNG